MFSTNFFPQKILFLHHLNIFFSFLLTFYNFQALLRKVYRIKIKKYCLYMYDPISDPPPLLKLFFHKNVTLWIYVHKKYIPSAICYLF
jgi:hypothetical protein